MVLEAGPDFQSVQIPRETLKKQAFPIPWVQIWGQLNRTPRISTLISANGSPPAQSRLFGSHVHLCRHNVPVFENVANLDELPTSGSTVIALPMKIAGGTGAPLRMIGIVQATRSPHPSKRTD